MSKHILPKPTHGGKPDPVDRLRQILQHLPEAQRVIVWEQIALGVAARCHEDKA